jgi:hypothetical protein
MKQTSQLIIAVLLGTISYAEAVKLQLNSASDSELLDYFNYA